GLQDLGVGLLQFELNMDFVVAACLIGQIALARVVLHRRLQRLDAASGRKNLATFSEKGFLVRGQVHALVLHLARSFASPPKLYLSRSSLIRGASPLGLPDTLSRSPLRRLAPFAWLARTARSPSDLDEPP